MLFPEVPVTCGDAFEESFKLVDCATILIICSKNLGKGAESIHELALLNSDRQSEKQLLNQTESIKFKSEKI